MSSVEATAERSSELQFLTLASRQVHRYIESFADLTADETREMQTFDEHGLADKQRLTKSALVVYRLQNDPKVVIEFRDVISVDGREVKGHEERAQKLWREVAESRSAQDEIRRITADGERFDIGIAETGLTLYEGLPLRSKCAGAFDFREMQRDVVDGHAVRVFAYRQVRPCDLVHYRIDIPARLADSRLVHVGELALDPETGQIVREERNLYAGDPEEQGIRLVHFVFGYGDSPFGILTPRIIVMEKFFAPESVNGVHMSFRVGARLVQTYGPFSRFEVSTGEKVISPAR